MTSADQSPAKVFGHQETSSEVVSLPFNVVDGFESCTRSMSVAISKDMFRMAVQSEMSELMRNTEVLESNAVDMRGIDDPVLLA